jgi:hypothetical protein
MSKLTDNEETNNVLSFRNSMSEVQGEIQIELNKIKFLSYSVELMCDDCEESPLTGIYPILNSVVTELKRIMFSLDDFEDFLDVSK